MTNSRKGRIIKMLSPENYIRQKSRTLPLYECLINSDWEDSKMANITIARKHTNGNITVCIYLIDLYCLGVKDTTWHFNMPFTEYEEMISGINDRLETEPVDYTLVHNIIYAGVDFAEVYGFYPHRDFTLITRYLLEEDSDEIELIDIECGMEGKPAYFRTAYHSDSEADRIIRTLERNAGHGNYFFFDEIENSLNCDEEDSDNDSYNDDPYNLRELTFEERKDMFIGLNRRTDNPDKKDIEKLTDLSEFLLDDICDNKLVEEHAAKLKEDLNIVILPPGVLPSELIGVSEQDSFRYSGLGDFFRKTYDKIAENPGKGRKMLKTMKAKTKDLPFIAFLELKLLEKSESRKYETALKEYGTAFPFYAPIRLLMDIQSLTDCKSGDEILDNSSRERYFHGRKSLHYIEMTTYLELKTIALAKSTDPNRIKAYIETLLEYRSLPEFHLLSVWHIMAIARLFFVKSYFCPQET